MIFDGWMLFYRARGGRAWIPVTREEVEQYDLCVADGLVDGAFASEGDALSAMMQFALGIRDNSELQRSYWSRKRQRLQLEFRVERVAGYRVLEPTDTAPT
jgi:hypothetical protein